VLGGGGNEIVLGWGVGGLVGLFFCCVVRSQRNQECGKGRGKGEGRKNVSGKKKRRSVGRRTGDVELA